MNNLFISINFELHCIFASIITHIYGNFPNFIKYYSRIKFLKHLNSMRIFFLSMLNVKKFHIKLYQISSSLKINLITHTYADFPYFIKYYSRINFLMHFNNMRIFFINPSFQCQTWKKVPYWIVSNKQLIED